MIVLMARQLRERPLAPFWKLQCTLGPREAKKRGCMTYCTEPKKNKNNLGLGRVNDISLDNP